VSMTGTHPAQKLSAGYLYLLALFIFLPLQAALAAPGSVLFNDDFERSNLGSDWTASDNQRAGIGTYTANSGTRSLYTRWNAVDVTSKSFDLSSVGGAELSMWIRIGDDINYNFSEWPDSSGEDLVIQYRNSTSNWITLETFVGGQETAGAIFNRTYTLPSDALHANFQIRISQTGGSGSGGPPGGYDYYHVDDVKLTETAAPPAMSYPFCDDFESGLGNWQITRIDGDAGTGSQTYSSASNSLFLRWGDVTVDSLPIDASAAINPQLSLWLRRGSDAFSETPDSGEDFVLEYLNSSGTWTQLDRFAGNGTPGEILQLGYNLPADAIYNGLKIRFHMLNGSGNNFDYWHVDDICVSKAPDPAAPIAYYAMDEGLWNGTPGEVKDGSGNNNNGHAVGSASTIADGKVCRAGDILFNDRDSDRYAIDTGLDVDSDIGNKGTIDFWYRSDRDWDNGGDRMLLDASNSQKYFYLMLTDNGRLKIGLEDDNDNDYRYETNDRFNYRANTWVHIGFAWDYSTGDLSIWVDGNQKSLNRLDRSFPNDTTGTTANLDTLYIGDSRNSYTQGVGGTSNSANGSFDELYVYNDVQTDAQIQTDMNATHPCSIACGTFKDTFSSKSYSNQDGSDNWSTNWLETNDDNRDNNGYIFINQNQLILAGGGASGSNYPTLQRQADLSSHGTAVLSFEYSTSTGRGRWNSGEWENSDFVDVLISSDGGQNWTTLNTFYGSQGSQPKIYTSNITNYISNNTRIAFRTGANRNDEEFYIDNVQIEACSTASSVDHYAISHSGTGVTCESEPVTITAHDNGHNAVAPSSTTTISLSASPAVDGWSLKSGNGSFNSSTNQYTFDGNESSVQFWLTQKTPVASIDIDVSDGTSSDPDDHGSEDPPIEFKDSGFRFYADGVAESIGTQISGKDSNIDPAKQTLTLRAVQTNTDTGACEARLTNQQTVSMGFECVDPTSCKTSNGVTITGKEHASPYSNLAGTAIADNNSGAISNYSNVTLDFGTDGTATLFMNYSDAGKIKLHAKKDIAASGNDPAITLTGSSNTFIVKPAGFCVISTDTNASCSGIDRNGDGTVDDADYALCSAFTSAGQNFNLTIKAVGWETSGESNSDFCTGNAVTPNFQLDSFTLGHTLVAPGSGNNGTLSTTTFNMAAGDDGITTVTQSVSEVGAFTFSATPPNYFTESLSASSSAPIGRFYPAGFAINHNHNAACSGGGTPFTYAGIEGGVKTGQTFTVDGTITAQNDGGVVTQNYLGPFALLTKDQITATANGGSGSLNNWTIDPLSFSAGVTNISASAQYEFTNATPPNLVPQNMYLSLSADDGEANGTENDSSKTVEYRIGQLLLLEAYGPETSNLQQDVVTQYVDAGGSYVDNAADSCTGFSLPGDVTFTNWAGNLASGETSVLPSLSTSTLNQGIGHITYSAPGDGNDGSVDTSINIPWLYHLDGGGNYVQPSGTLHFGHYRGDDRFLFWKETQ